MTVYFVILCLVSNFKPDSKPYFAIDPMISRSTSFTVIILMSVAFAGSLKLWSVVSVMKFGPAKEVSDDATTGGATGGSTTGGETSGGGTAGGSTTTGGGGESSTTEGSTTTGTATDATLMKRANFSLIYL